jgi:ABC-type protease/lipase transport system fused ATPase/permease subunit
LYGEPRLLVLDEPNANLDEEGDAALSAALAAVKARGITVVVVSHRRRLIAQLDRIAILRDGKIEAFGPSSLVLGKLGEGSKVVPFAHPAQVSA